MKSSIKLFFTTLFLLTFQNYSSQEVVEIEEVEETVLESTEYSNPQSNRVVNKDYYDFGRKYTLDRINDDFDWFYDKNATYNDKRYGIVNKKGEVILPNLFKKGYSYSGDKNTQILYIDNNYGIFNLLEKKWNVPLEYDYIQKINNNFYKAKKNGSHKIIDSNNTIISNENWYSVEKINKLENYAIVSKNSNSKLYGIYSLLEKKLVIPCLYSSLRTLKNGNFKVELEEKGMFNIININNKLLFKIWYSELTEPYKTSNRYVVKRDNFYGVVDGNEKIIVPFKYLSIKTRAYNDGSFMAQNEVGKYGFMTIDGKVTLPFIYDKLKKNYNSNSLISLSNEKCGIVKVNSGRPEEIISCEYDKITDIQKIFITEQNNKFGILDANGNTVIEPKFENLEVINPKRYSDAILKAKLKGKYLLINQFGNQLNSEKYDDINFIKDAGNSSSYSTKYTFLKVKNKGKYSIIDKVGKSISEAKFDDIISEYNNIFIVKSKNKYGIYSLVQNKMLVDYSYQLISKTKQYFVGINNNKVDILKYSRGKINVRKIN